MAIPISHHHHHQGTGSAGTAFVRDAGPVVIPTAEGGGSLALPEASFIVDGQFVRNGNDLLIRDAAGGEVVVRDYFAWDHAPVLTSPDGSQVLAPGLVDSFLTPAAAGQYAQAAAIPGAAPIGQVIDINGDAFAVRADGTRVQLAKGDAVHEGDIVETGGAASAIRMVFTDKTEFSLGADARLSLDQLVFNPDTQSGEAQFSILKGVFIFASGQIAKTDNTDMTVITPVATIGIRGTEVAGRVSASDSQFTVIDGAIEVTTQVGSVTLDDRGETTQVAGNDSPPGEPVVLTPSDFGKAYGAIAGVASTYFDQSQPDMQSPAPAGETPAAPDSPDASPAPADPGDRSDAGAASGGAALAGLISPENLGAAPLAASLADGTTIAAVATAPFAAAAEVVQGIQSGDPLAVVAVPGLDLASNLTFSPLVGPAAGPAGFELLPSLENIAAFPGELTQATGIVQIALSPGQGAAADAVSAALVSVDMAGDSPPLDQLSTGGSGSPFRGETGSAGADAANPYVTTPFGYSGPQLGDPIFDLVGGGQGVPDGSSGVDDVIRSVTESLPTVPLPTQAERGSAGSTPPVPDPGPDPESEPSPAEITLTVSHATDSQRYQDLTFNFVLPNDGPGRFDIGGDQMHLPGVSAKASIGLQRDGDGSVEVAVTSDWDSVKNIRAESATAADIAIDNFVHADVSFGDGGDSDITIRGAKRGFVTTGDGNDRIDIEAYSNGDGWSHTFDVRAGAGDDMLTFKGATNGLSHLVFDGGAGTDTLKLSGPGQSFSLLAGQIEVTGVERIDISGTGNTTLTLPSNLSGASDLLIVDGDAGDALELHGSGWNPAGSTEIEGQSYAVYEHASGMRVAADVDVHVT